MKIVVTGTKGYISEKVSTYFADRGYEVERLSLRSEEIEEEKLNSESIIIHVAGVTPSKALLAEDYYNINTKKTKYLAEICEKRGVKHFIYISTMAVYGQSLRNIGDNSIGLNTECRNPSHYGKSKLLAEEELKVTAKNMIWTILRVPSLYDENRLGYFEPYLKALKKFPILPKFKFCTKRSILCIDNLCKGLFEVVENRENIFTNKIVLPADDYTPDMNEIFKKLLAEQNRKKIFFKMGLRGSKIIAKFFKPFLSFSMNVYYSEADCYKIVGRTIFDINITKEKQR